MEKKTAVGSYILRGETTRIDQEMGEGEETKRARYIIFKVLPGITLRFSLLSQANDKF